MKIQKSKEQKSALTGELKQQIKEKGQAKEETKAFERKHEAVKAKLDSLNEEIDEIKLNQKKYDNQKVAST